MPHRTKMISSFGELNNWVSKKSVPLNALLETTHRCNLHCRHCYVCPERRKELTLGEIKNVLDQLAESGCLFLTLTGGEPFMRVDLLEIIAYARMRKFAVRLFTNGTLIDGQQSERLADLKVVDVAISLYGASSKVHERIAGVPDSFKRSLQALKLLKQQGISTVVKFTVMKENLSEVTAVRDLAKEIGAHFQSAFALFPKTDGSRQNLELRLEEEGLRYLFEDEILCPREGVLQKRQQNLKKKNVGKRVLCSAGRDMCTISPYGDLLPCVTLPVKIGNLREVPFRTLWASSPELRSLRRLRCSDLKGCQECSSYGNCYRCPGLALLEHGDMLEPCDFVCQIEEVEKSIVNRGGEKK